MNRKATIVLLIISFLLISKFWVGIYTHDEFGGKHTFIKHRTLWQTFFYSPRGMSDMKIEDMSAERQKEQKLFDEFVLGQLTID